MTQDNEMKPAQREVEGFVIIIVFVNVMLFISILLLLNVNQLCFNCIIYVI